METIRSIAKKAGVSKSTVSRYLNKGYVSADAKDKIEKTIAESNYIPNEFARNLKANQSNFFGVIIPRFNSPATISILEGIDNYGGKKEYQKLIVNAHQDPGKEIETIYSLEKNRVAGIILIATEVTPQHIAAIKEVGTPVIVLGQFSSELYCITYDEYQSAYSLTNRLLKKSNYKKVIYVGVTQRDVSVGQNRKSGVVASVMEHQVEHFEFYETTFQSQDAYQLGKQILHNAIGSLIICATDNIAIGIMKAARELKINIPEQFAIAGFGGHDIGDEVYPTLTTVDYHFENLGKIAAESLELLISGEEIPQNRIVETTMMLKESVF